MKTMLMVLLALVLCGCPKAQQVVSREAVDKAVESNNTTVELLTKVQQGARDLRSAMLEQIAKIAPSKESGLAAMDATDKRFAPIWDSFRKAEAVQSLLATALEAAQVSLRAGEDPDLSKVLDLYGQVQRLYADTMLLLAEVR